MTEDEPLFGLENAWPPRSQPEGADALRVPVVGGAWKSRCDGCHRNGECAPVTTPYGRRVARLAGGAWRRHRSCCGERRLLCWGPCGSFRDRLGERARDTRIAP